MPELDVALNGKYRYVGFKKIASILYETNKDITFPHFMIT